MSVITDESRGQGFICAYCGTRFAFSYESTNLERIQAQIDHATVCPWNPVVAEAKTWRAEATRLEADLVLKQSELDSARGELAAAKIENSNLVDRVNELANRVASLSEANVAIRAAGQKRTGKAGSK